MKSQRTIESAACQRILRFADVELDLDTAELRRAGKVTILSTLTHSLLEYLVRNRERVIGHEELVTEVWRGVSVSEGSLRQAVWELRQALGDTARDRSAIQTVRGRGYRFAAALHSGNALASLQGATVRAGAPLPARKTFFGRTAELARLEAMLGEACELGGRSCSVIGPAGIGKSRLVRELVYLARVKNILCLEACPDPDGFAPAFWLWRQIFRGYLDSSDLEQRARCEAAAPVGFRLLAAELVEPPEPTQFETSHAQRHFALLEELSRLFMVMASDRASLLLFEDLQWADDSSLALLRHVAQHLPRTRSLLVVTCRAGGGRPPSSMRAALDALRRSALSECIELTQLTVSELTSMLEAHVATDVPAALCTEVHALSHGNPLFALELARALAQPKREPNQQLLPEQPEIRLVIHRNLNGLPEPAYHTLLAASVLTPEFALAELAAVLQEPAQAVLGRVDICIEHGVLTEAGSASRFRFAHPLIREAAYTSLGRAERARLHRLAGEWIERFDSAGVDRVAELAHHFFVAAPDQSARKAVDYALRCAELAYAATAYQDAVDHYERALSCANLEPPLRAEEKLEIELARGEALRAAGADSARVDQHFLAIGEAADALGHVELHGRAILGYTGQRSVRFSPTRFAVSSHAKELALIERALDRLGPSSSELRTLLLCSLLYSLSYTAARTRREQVAREALKMARELKLPWLTIRVLATTIYCCAAPDAHGERLRACDELIELAQAHELMTMEAEARVTRAVCLCMLGERSAAERDAARAQELCRHLDSPRIKARTEQLTLLEAFWQGDLPKAEQLTQRAFEVASEDLVERTMFVVRTSFLHMLRHGPQPAQVEQCEQLLRMYPEAVGLRCLLACSCAELGMMKAAEQYFDSVTRDGFRCLPEDLHWLSALCLLAVAANLLRDKQRAALVYQRLLPFGHLFDFYLAEACPAGPVAYSLCGLAMTMGEYRAAERWLDVAEQLNQRLGARLFSGYAQIARAGLLLLSRPSERDRALTLMQGAIEYADRIGARALGQSANRILRECGEPTSSVQARAID